MDSALLNSQYFKDSANLLKTLKTIYPLIISANLTQNVYHMLEYDSYLNKTAGYDGSFDDLIAAGASTMHPDDRQLFIDTFCRESQLKAFSAGEKEINLDCRQIDRQGHYHWVHTQVVKVNDPDTDDILQYTFSRPNDEMKALEQKNAEANYLRRSQAGGYHRCEVAFGYPFIDISPRFCEIFGYTREEIKTLFDNKYLNMVHPEDKEKLTYAISDELSHDGKTSAQVAYRMSHKDRGWIWVKDNTELCVFDGIEFYQGTVLDITEEHKILEELLDKTHQLDIIINSIPGGIIVSNIDNGFELEYISPEIGKSFGFSQKDLDGLVNDALKTAKDPKAPSNSRNFLNNRMDSIKEKGTYNIQYDIHAKDGSLKHVAEFGKLHTDRNGQRHLYTFIMDITSEYEKAQLVEDQKRNLDLLETINVLSMDYSYIFFNDMDTDYTQMLTTSDSDYVFQLYDMEKTTFNYTETVEIYAKHIVHPDDFNDFREATKEETVRRELTEHDDYTYYYRILVNGELGYRQIKFARYNRQEKTFQILVGFKNVDEQMRREQEQKALLSDALAQAEYANKAKSQFLNNMSHDIRTPMNAIMGYNALATTHIDDKERVLDYLTKVSHASNHLLSLINDVLDMSRIESGKMNIDEQEANLADIIHDIRSIIQSDIQSKRLEFFVDIMDVTEEHIFCDKLRLNQILLNLLSNAIKFTAPGGLVSLRIIQKSVSETGVVTYEFHVKDTGIGMSQSFMEHIFEPFTREHTTTVSSVPGTGLGMAITKNIVDMLGGKITVTSEENKGTEFVVSLPFRLHSSPTKVDVIVDLDGVRGIVVDDDLNTCMSVSKMLRQIGMRSEWSMYGKEAVARAKEAMEMGDPFHVYIIDWLMADMNGIETARQIRRTVGDDIPIIILTAYDWADIEDEAREAGVTAFINKPLFLSDLHRVLSETCTERNQVEEESPAKAEKRNIRILLAEDNELNQEIACELLKDAGFEIEVASNGKIAVDMLKASQPDYYKLILMDIQMPVMDGYQAATEIRKLKDKSLANIPIVAMTANAFKSDEKLAFEAGMNGHVAKPVDINKLLDVVMPLINE